MGFNSIVLLCLCFLVLGHRVGGYTQLSSDEDLEIERQLKLLNKPAVETIQVDDGDIFDCIDINKQPAFDHPLLKHHVVKMKPSSYPIGMLDEPSSLDIISPVGLKDRECPQGTVPIKRVRREDLVRAKFLSEDRERYHTTDDASDAEPKPTRQWAIYVIEEGNYYGASAYINVYGHPQMPMGEHTSSEIWVSNDNGGKHNTNIVKAGWTVNPELFGDTKTRLFTEWTADRFYKRGCYNILCPGFVQVSGKIGLGSFIEPISKYNGTQYVTPITLFRDPKTRDWWFAYGLDKTPVGYWPSELFAGLSNYATRVDFGGYVSYPPNQAEGPPMGSGHFPGESTSRACYVSKLQVANQNNIFRYVEPNELYVRETSPNCYKVGPYFSIGYKAGYAFYFGGPGGCKS